MTFEPTRVLLGKPSEKDQIENYINANFINIEGKVAIATQAPPKTTFHNFWRMVEQYKVERIFMLSSLIEKGKLICDRYYPVDALPESTLKVEEYEIRLLQEFDLNKKKTIKIRKLQLNNTKTKTIMYITHFQQTDWIDGEVPNRHRKRWTNYLVN
jgi:protein tyrosine phosphatase